MLRLVDEQLGDIGFRCDPFVVVAFEIGGRPPREVVYERALAHGSRDDTRFGGERAVSLTLRFNEQRCDGGTVQALVDRLVPFLAVDRRPWLEWSLPGSPSVIRGVQVRRANYSMPIAGERHPVMALSWVTVDGGHIVSRGEDWPDCRRIDPSVDVEPGRTYNLEPDRVYPPAGVLGERTVRQDGNAPAHWVGRIVGPVTGPTLRINDVVIAFPGVDVPAGGALVIDTRGRWVRYNADADEPRYHLANYREWSWGGVLLPPGDNRVRFDAEVLGTGSYAELCWSPTWEA